MTGWLWALWGTVACTIGGLAYRDWHNPEENRAVVAVAAGTFGVLLAIAAVLIVVFS